MHVRFMPVIVRVSIMMRLHFVEIEDVVNAILFLLSENLTFSYFRYAPIYVCISLFIIIVQTDIY